MATTLWLMSFIVPFIVLTYSFFRFRKEITKFEYVFVAITGYCITALLVLTLEKMYEYSSAYDTEIWNGQVTNKHSERVSCEHEYICGQTCTGSGKKRSCHPKYCHEHSYDVDWIVNTSVGNVEIDRVDRRGLDEPPRFTSTTIGEPASSENSYENRLLLDEDSLFNRSKSLVGKYQIPTYPVVYDYYRITRVFNDTNLNIQHWNSLLNDWLRVDGAVHQVNVVVFVTNNPENYADAVFAAWKGGKKNDVLVVIGNQDGKVKWIRSTSYAKGIGNELLHSQLLVSFTGDQINDELIIGVYGKIKQYYKRYTVEQFEQMVHITPKYPWGVYLIVLLLSSGIMCGLVRLALDSDFYTGFKNMFKRNKNKNNRYRF